MRKIISQSSPFIDAGVTAKIFSERASISCFLIKDEEKGHCKEGLTNYIWRNQRAQGWEKIKGHTGGRKSKGAGVGLRFWRNSQFVERK